jgi:hypothetical protein
MSRQVLESMAVAAATIERRGDLPCGGCGGRHVSTGAEYKSTEDPCRCECCIDAGRESLGEWIEAEHPDLVTIQRGRRVISRAAVDEAMRRLEAEIASLDGAIAEPDLS